MKYQSQLSWDEGVQPLSNLSEAQFYKQRRDEWQALSDAIWKHNVRIAEIGNLEMAALLEDHTDSLLEQLALERQQLEVERTHLENQRDDLKSQYWGR